MPFFIIQLYATDKGISAKSSFWLLAVMNLSSAAGRVLPNYIADRYGNLQVLIPCTFLSGVLVYCLPACETRAALLVEAALYGFF
jgi:predicted MFS family arabinose efflux permease